jgi:glycosyltransferase involved in cell wall biosynthesis
VSRAAHPLKILMVTPRYFPDMGGTEMHVHEVGRRLAQSGIDVTLLTTIPHQHAQSVPPEEDVEGMHIFRIPAWPKHYDLYLAPALRAFIKQGHWDLIHIQGCHTFFPPLAMLTARATKTPYVVTFHSGGHSSHVRMQLRNVQWTLLRPLLAHAEKLIGVSHFETQYFRDVLHFSEKRFAVIPNGFSHPDVPCPLQSKPATNTQIISVGRLERYKGHHHLITALPKIREQYPDATLLILGTGPYEETLRTLAQQAGVADYVTIRSIPANNRQEMMTQLSQASLITLLSEYESQGIAIMEALALKRPVLVSDTSALREYAEKKLVRMVSLQSTPEEIAAAVIEQLHHPLIPGNLELPTWDDCANQLKTLYQTTVKNHVYAVR